MRSWLRRSRLSKNTAYNENDVVVVTLNLDGSGDDTRGGKSRHPYRDLCRLTTGWAQFKIPFVSRDSSHDQKACHSTIVAMSKYDSLTNFLLSQPSGPITMTFTQVNTLLGFCIPAQARKYQAWWANETNQNTRHRQSRSWLKANRKASADLKHGVVTFFQ